MAISRLRQALLLAALAAGPAAAAGPETVLLDVAGMSCSLCEITAKKALERVPGVVAAKAYSDLKRAEVKYDPAKVAPSELAAVLSRSGFAATVRPE